MKKIFALSMLAIVVLIGCSTSRQVQRVDPGQQTDLSGRWNDTDSRLVAEEMVRDGLARVWLTDFLAAKGRKPVIIVGFIKNKTHELISSDTFIKDIEREFINSGKVTIVQAGAAREELRAERSDQQDFTSPETIKKWGQEKGADFILQGVINSIVDSEGKQSVVYYQVDLELTNLETNEKGWIGTQKIKKAIQN
jgi:uncharacterized protein (TIGR02722 family)